MFNNKHRKAGIRTIKMIIAKKHNIVMNLKKIARIKNDYNLKTTIRKKNKYNIFAHRQFENRIAPNILERDFNQTIPDKVYSTDISYLFYNKGQKAYLSATKDLATKEIVSYSVNRGLEIEIGYNSIETRLKTLKQEQLKDLIIHSDQGVHYTNQQYINKLKSFGVIQSMSRRGNCLDNSPIESFFGHLKDEVNLKNCKTFEEVKNVIENYINYYNNERYQWKLDKMTPIQYRCHLLKNSS